MAEHAVHHHEEIGPDTVFGQYETIEQQRESYIVGMWTFLVTEVMFFGGLFLVYTLYRWKYADTWYNMSERYVSWEWGGLNTVILLVSSYFVAKAVQSAQLRNVKRQIGFLWLTVACACGFLIVKYIEYSHKIHDRLYPDWYLSVPGGLEEGPTRLYLSLYFAMTGLHGVHVAVGIIVITTLIFMTKFKAPSVRDYIPTEMVALYWHFVDLVWIFLYPLFYLVPH